MAGERKDFDLNTIRVYMQEFSPEFRSDPTSNRTGSEDSYRTESPFTCGIQYGKRTRIDLNASCKHSNNHLFHFKGFSTIPSY